MPFTLKKIAIPDFGMPVSRPKIPPATYAERCRRAYATAACDWLVVYGDREHFGNIAFLSGFEPRFEEALLLLGKGGVAIIVTGNENQDYAAAVADLPGVALKDVRIDVDAGNVLRISAERVEEQERDDVRGGVTYHRSERTSGRQWRSLQLPQGVDASRIAAKLENGVLCICAPKIEGFDAGGRRRIAINAA